MVFVFFIGQSSPRTCHVNFQTMADGIQFRMGMYACGILGRQWIDISFDLVDITQVSLYFASESLLIVRIL